MTKSAPNNSKEPPKIDKDLIWFLNWKLPLTTKFTNQKPKRRNLLKNWWGSWSVGDELRSLWQFQSSYQIASKSIICMLTCDCSIVQRKHEWFVLHHLQKLHWSLLHIISSKWVKAIPQILKERKKQQGKITRKRS